MNITKVQEKQWSSNHKLTVKVSISRYLIKVQSLYSGFLFQLLQSPNLLNGNSDIFS